RDDPRFVPASTSELAASLPPIGIGAASSIGFCLTERDSGGVPVSRCYSWQACPLDEGDVLGPLSLARRKQGQLLTAPLDSGVERCDWHRVGVDADLPPRTTIELKVATSDNPALGSQGDAAKETGWEMFPAGVPFPTDWQSAPAAS